MNARPLVGILCCKRTVTDLPAQAVLEKYLEALMRFADVDAVLLPSLPGNFNARALLGRLDGAFLTGSPSNIEPGRYAKETAEATGPFDPGRDAAALGLIDAAISAGKPLFGICRGMQEINVAFGGTLRRDLSMDDRPLRHHAPADADLAPMYEHGHKVRLRTGGILAAALGAEEIEVNSVHYQGVERLGHGLVAEAQAPDGVVEAVTAVGGRAPVFGVQWHPEWRTADSPASLAYFRLFGLALRGATLEQAAQSVAAEMADSGGLR
jgi:putative glutamine amidotransferase